MAFVSKRLLFCTKRLFARSLNTGFLKINGTEIYYEHTGTSSEGILCIPGALGCCRSDFSLQLDHLSKDFSVIAFDPRGYGLSQKHEREFPEDFYHKDAADAGQVMKQLGFKKYSILGWSDGGIVGMILASREKEAIKKLVVWGSNSHVTQDDINFVEKTRDLEKWSERMRKPLEDTYGKEGLNKLWNGWMDGFAALANNPNGICKNNLKDIGCPTLIIHGAKDAMLPSFHAEYINENIKNSKLVVWPEGKHNLHMRYYEDFNKLVTGFIKDDGQC